MRAFAILKIGAATLAAGFTLAVITIWREYPGWGPSCEGDCEVFLPPFEYVVKIAAALLTLLWTASVAIRVFPGRPVMAATIACALSGAVGAVFLSVAVAPVFGQYRFPVFGTATYGAVAALIGALIAWASVGGGLTRRRSGRVIDKVQSRTRRAHAAHLNC
jgi:hypothetical protein